MPSCWAARFGSRSGVARSAPARSRCSFGEARRAQPCCSMTRQWRSPSCGAGCRELRSRRAVSPRISKRRLTGIDRSGAPPEATQSGHPLNPWTIPNLIDYLRLLGIPVFLIVAFSSDDGMDALAVVLFATIGWSDYLDGFVARLTGQYSRLGALLDPLIDRLLIVSGMVVCWHFNLLPRWAIAIVIGRELFMLVASRYALSHGVELVINWPGRIGVAPIAGAPFFAMAGVHWLALIMLYVGMALGLVSAALYVRRGTREIRARREHTAAPSQQTKLSS